MPAGDTYVCQGSVCSDVWQ